MKQRVIGLAAAVLSVGAGAMTASFDGDTIGAAPSGWTCGVTGKGRPHWSVATEPGTTGQTKVLLQYGGAQR